MRIRGGILCVALLLSSLQACSRDREVRRPGDEHREEPPHVLLISLDALAAEHLGCYGYDRDTTPFIDEIAARGVRFSHAFINCHPTSPSHATILSSQYQENHKLFTSSEDLKEGLVRTISPDVTMVQEILRSHGYTTWAITGGGFTMGNIGFGRGFDVFQDGRIPGTGGDFDAFFDLIDERSSDAGPVFAFLHTYKIHAPYTPPEPYRSLFGSFDSRFEPTQHNLLESHTDTSGLSREDIELIKARYDGNIRSTDDMLRSFFSRLEETGFLSNAVVIVTSDHGEEFGEHGGLLHGGGKLYDELLRVPLIISGTGVPEGQVVDRLVSSIDIAPTILAAAGVETEVPMMGKNLLAPSPVPAEEQVVFSQWEQSYYSVRTRDWKLIANDRGGIRRKPRKKVPRFELYDLRNDPREQRNLAKRFPDRVERMEKILDAWMAGIDRSPEPGVPITLSEETLRHLKALGYIE